MSQGSYINGLDGIRAIAVVLVCLNHLRVPGFEFGFVGVDIFFVLSGFLITYSLLGRARSGVGHDYVGFWARRMLRLWPALFVTILFCVAVSFLIGFIELEEPQENIGYAISALLMVLNFKLWWDKADYFGGGVESPFLHLWSLSVEEQFYLLFPLLLFLVWGFRARFVLVLLGVLGSFAVALYFTYNPILAYYASPTRFWQLLVGVLLALLFHRGLVVGPGRIPGWAWMLAALALVPLLAGITEQGYPGWQAWIPTLFSALLIGSQIAGGNTFLGGSSLSSRADNIAARLMSGRLMAGVGRRSYVIYLLHWPLILALGHVVDGPVLTAALFVLLMIPMVELVHRQVELRFMRLRAPRPMPVVLTFVAVSLSLVLGLGVLLRVTDGVASEGFVFQQIRANAASGYGMKLECQSFRRPFDGLAPASECMSGSAVQGPLIVVWGDSHAAHYGPLFDEYTKRHGMNLLVRAMGGCLPSPSYSITDAWRDDCARFNAFVVEELRGLARTMPLIVVLSGRWGGYPDGAIAPLSGDAADVSSAPFAALESALRDSVAFVTGLGAQAVIIRNTPNFDVNPLRCVVEKIDCPGYYEPIGFLQAAERFDGQVPIVDFNARLCPELRDCPIVVDRIIAYSDKTHLSNSMSRALVEQLEATLVD